MNKQNYKTVRFHEIGDASVLKMEEIPVNSPGDLEVRIRVEAIGLNRADIMFRTGSYLEDPVFPSKLGYEAAGYVDEIGAGVTEFSIGDHVSTIPAFSMGKYGVYGEQIIVPAHAVSLCPATFSSQQSVAIWMPYITAYGALIDIGKIKKEHTVLITAASSSVGVAAIHTAKMEGAVVIATTRGAEKKDFLFAQGADHVIQTNSEDLIEFVSQVTNKEGVDLVFDPIGGPVLSELAKTVKAGGLIIEYGALDSKATPYPLFTALAKGLTIRGYTLFEITQNSEKLQQAKRYLSQLFNSGKVKPVIDRVFPFEDIQTAHQYMESNQQKGKVVVTV